MANYSKEANTMNIKSVKIPDITNCKTFEDINALLLKEGVTVGSRILYNGKIIRFLQVSSFYRDNFRYQAIQEDTGTITYQFCDNNTFELIE